MVKLIPQGVDRQHNNTPILYDREIDDFAHAVLEDYKPELLHKPGTIDFQHFLESYLGVRIDFQDIFYDDPDRPILAMTVFKNSSIKVFDKENECVKKIIVPARTVIINNLVMEPGKECLALFSGMHEGGHIIIHWNVYTGETFDGEAYEPDYDYDSKIETTVCCRRENIENISISKKKRTAKEWREHQADYFAAAITMPNITFIPYVHRLLRENGYYKRAIRLGRDNELDILGNDIIPDAISEVYGVSMRAARIKLRKTNFILSN
jgi:Zn-dependent peptidase ImmA (M78 family)